MGGNKSPLCKLGHAKPTARGRRGLTWARPLQPPCPPLPLGQLSPLQSGSSGAGQDMGVSQETVEQGRMGRNTMQKSFP